MILQAGSGKLTLGKDERLEEYYAACKIKGKSLVDILQANIRFNNVIIAIFNKDEQIDEIKELFNEVRRGKVMAYRCVTVSAEPGEEVMKKIYEVLNQEDGYFNTRFQLRFIGFEAEKGTEFKINKVKNKVPSTGYFITPYDGAGYMTISSLIFDNGCNNQSFYIIY